MITVEDFAKVRVLCLGDVMADYFVLGSIKRISPESPVPVFCTGKSEQFPGGAANVARNIAALGGRCTLVGVVGDDARGRSLAESFSGTAITPLLTVVTDRPTTGKLRYVAQGQHVLRVDDEETKPIAPAVAAELGAVVAREIGQHDVLVLSDYAKGVLTDAVLQTAIAAARAKGIPVVVDPKSPNLARYGGATVITPNAREIEAATGIDVLQDDAAAAAGAARALEMAACDAVLITRSEKGMTLLQRGGGAVQIASNAREVFDVAGAGDTVVATLALALGDGAGLEAAARVANVAAGLAVGKRGTAAISQSDLIAVLSRPGQSGDGAAKILDRDAIARRVRTWKRDGLKVGFTNGCFDLLHVGHLRILEYAKAHCDRLVVAVNDDASVRRLKGSSRPINDEIDRAEILAALGVVDAVHVFGEDTPQELIALLTPDVLVKGADYRLEDIVGADVVLAAGGQVLRFELIPEKSSTGIIKKAALKIDAGRDRDR